MALTAPSKADHAASGPEPLPVQLSGRRSHLNLDWPRRSDDIDIFHDNATKKSPKGCRNRHRRPGRSEGFSVTVDVRAYGTWEATVSDRFVVNRNPVDERHPHSFLSSRQGPTMETSAPPGRPRGQQGPRGLEPKEGTGFCRYHRDRRQHVSDRTARHGRLRKTTGVFSAEDYRTDTLARAGRFRCRISCGEGPSSRLDPADSAAPK